MQDLINQFLEFKWLEVIFSSTHMQVKVSATIFALILFPLIRRIVVTPIVNKIKDSKKRYLWSKRTSYFIYIFQFIIFGSIWFEGFESIATYLGFVSAAIAFALKDPIANVAGWMFITTRAPFKVGDRIELGSNAGDVIDVNLFNFSIMEMGNWVDADDMTGRIIHIPNARVFTESLANYGKGFHFIWHEIPVLVTFESDWKKAKKILNKVIKNKSNKFKIDASKMIKEASKKFMIHKTSLEPIVYTTVEDSGVELTIRFLCEPRQRREIEQDIWESILDEFKDELDIDFAYPTVRRYMNKEESKEAILEDSKSINGNG
tara:strand:+ start:139 stop:1095 length:957 start_codon:yes stop_codon:yes gene_type:complete